MVEKRSHGFFPMEIQRKARPSPGRPPSRVDGPPRAGASLFSIRRMCRFSSRLRADPRDGRSPANRGGSSEN
jgi:hypothetical protein